MAAEQHRGWRALRSCNMRDCALQGTASPPCPSVVSTSTKDPFWRRVRKGVAPAFSPSNIQCARPCPQPALHPPGEAVAPL